jgi:hypothetical protein
VYALESGRLQWPEVSEKIRQNVKVAIAGLNSKQVTLKQIDLAVRQNDRVILRRLCKRFADMTEIFDNKSFVNMSPKKTDHLQCVAI